MTTARAAEQAHGYLSRKKRTEWSEAMRMDNEVKILDVNGEWVICRTCTELYEKTRKGRRPNDQYGFKVKMNAPFQEAAWLMHKNRVVGHRVADTSDEAAHDDSDQFLGGADGHELATDAALAAAGSDSAGVASTTSTTVRHVGRKRPKPVGSSSDRDDSEDEAQQVGALELVEDSGGDHCHVSAALSHSGPFFMEEMKFDDEPPRMNVPRTGWRCPGIVPDSFYSTKAELVHAFAKYYVGHYRINVVRDIRSDKVMLFAHDCENKVVQRDRPSQPVACEKCYEIWSTNKSFKRILRKMERYNAVEDILRQSWSLTDEQLTVLANFRHSSGSNLNLEGRKLKQAAIVVLKRYKSDKPTAAKSAAQSGPLSALPLGSLPVLPVLPVLPMVAPGREVITVQAKDTAIPEQDASTDLTSIAGTDLVPAQDPLGASEEPSSGASSSTAAMV
ncbi:TPA: hypothetical protein N0F65_004150 [Lagenidium giganteum]|uniref:Uncharacterized protein n=1 Tax=Lagenidium giganteum TaxID=4803 RepID=A0AAV2Z8I3_9STRA|nr:TPA: hypothetical protein N0F65_004150 [Lagenidium giganteum]